MTKYLLAFQLIFSLTTVFSQELASSLLWKISGNELDTPSYVYGTIHVICSEEMKISNTLIDALDRTSVMVMELDMDDPTMKSQLQSYSFNDNHENIADELNASDVEIIDKFLIDNFNTELSQIGIFKPLVLTSMITMKMLPCSKVASTELELIKLADLKSMDIVGLESVKDQMTVFDSIPQSEQLKWLVDMIKNLDKTRKEYSDLVYVYLQQDIDKIYEYSTKLPEYEEYEDLFIESRNKKWIPVIEKQLKLAPSFIAVGAGHLGSDKGLIKLLQEKGYKVEPVYLE